MKQKCIVLIDGSNFYFKLKDLGLHNLLTFKFSKFIQFIARSDEVVSASYYIGRIRQDQSSKTQKLFDAQQRQTLPDVKFIPSGERDNVTAVITYPESVYRKDLGEREGISP